MSALLLTALAALAATTSAHGTVSGLVADGTFFGGFKLDYYYMAKNGQTPPATPGWSAENLDNGYVGGDQSTYDSPDIICHKAAKNSATSATVKAGGKLAFQWTAWPESHVGPVITYAANCGGDCSTVKKEDLKFVKVDEAGFENGKWAAVAMIANNNTYEMTVPSTLAAGKYVFRHEIIALHSAGNVNGAQNYPQCLNIEVTGSGTESPEGTLGTKLYTNQDKGILFNVYTQNIDYPIPGPALMGGSGSGSGSAPASSASATKPAATSSSAPKPTSAAPATTQAPSKPVTTSAPASNNPVTSTTAQVTQTVGGSQPSATATSAPATGNDNALPKTFTAETFIAWFEKQAGISSAKARRHAREFFDARLP